MLEKMDIEINNLKLSFPEMSENNKKRKVLEDDEEDDIISKTIGQFGKWQLQQTFLLSLFNIPCTWHIFVPTFHGALRPVWCARPQIFQKIPPAQWIKTTQSPDYCKILDFSNATLDVTGNITRLGNKYIKCKLWEFGGEGSTVISEFDLVCERQTLNNMADMLFLLGVAFGGIICGIISDKYGRKRTLMVSVFIQAMVGTAIAFAPFFELYCFLRAALGFISVSVVFSGFVLAIELVGGKWRTITGISYLFPVAISYMTITGLAYLVRDWRHLQLLISVPGFLFVSLIWVLPESPHWLLAMGKTDHLIKVLQTAARRNNRKLSTNFDKQLLPVHSATGPESFGLTDLFKTSEMRNQAFLLLYIWFAVYLVYYGLMLNLENIGGNLYISSMLFGAVEIPALALSIIILLKGGRRWPLALTMMISGVPCCFVITLKTTFSDLQWLITALTMTSKFSISCSNAIIPVFTAELYPTTLRNIGVGVSNVSAGVALVIIPYLKVLEGIHTAIPMAIIAFFGITGGILVLFLPETGKEPLHETCKDVTSFRRESRILSRHNNTK